MIILQAILIIMFVLVLISAAIMDYRYKEVYVFFWWVCDSLAIGKLALYIYMQTGGDIMSIKAMAGSFVELIIFILLQNKLFLRMYGAADTRAFSSCGIMMASFGFGLLDNLLFMAAVFGLLFVVQLIKRNIGRDGNLKSPVPLIPYIAFSFIFLVYFTYF